MNSLEPWPQNDQMDGITRQDMTWYTQVRPTNEGIQHLGLHFLTINPCELYEPMDASLWICVWLMWRFLWVRGPPAVGDVAGWDAFWPLKILLPFSDPPKNQPFWDPIIFDPDTDIHFVLRVYLESVCWKKYLSQRREIFREPLHHTRCHHTLFHIQVGRGFIDQVDVSLSCSKLLLHSIILLS